MKESNNNSPIGLNYGTDAAVLIVKVPPPSVPFVIYGPGNPEAIHVANERVPITEVLEAEAVLSRFLSNLSSLIE